MNARLVQAARIPADIGSLILGVLLAPAEWRWTPRRAIACAAIGITTTAILIWAWPR
jgi:hypothetical protein